MTPSGIAHCTPRYPGTVRHSDFDHGITPRQWLVTRLPHATALEPYHAIGSRLPTASPVVHGVALPHPT